MSEFDAPQSRKEAILQNMLGANNVLEPPQSREEILLQQILESGGGGGGGRTVTPESIVTATGKMTPAQAAQTRGNLGAAVVATVETVSGTNPTITPVANTIYHCSELTSLTISNPTATGKYSIIFCSGATPTTTVGIENFAAEANKRYKITVEDNYATYDSWPYTPT